MAKEKKEKLVLKKDMSNEEKLAIIPKMIEQSNESIEELKEKLTKEKAKVENLKNLEKAIKYDMAFPQKEK